ncbi:MAG: S41 family peptidase [Bryobacteraceae bacterium]
MRPLRCGPILVCLSVLSAFSTNRGLDGIWQSEGYGNVFKIQGTRIESFQFTTTTCVKGPTAYFIGASRSARNSEGGLFTIRDGDSADYKLLHPIGSAGEIRLDRISTLPSVCKQLTANTPAANFEVFARSFAEHYISLDLKHVNWDTLTEHARGVITPATSPTKLFEIMKGLIEPFGDGHTGIDASAIHREFEGFRPGGYQLTEGKAEEEFIKHKMPIIWGITDRFLSAKPRNFANGQIAYGRVGKNIGYLRILAMGGYSKHGNGEADLRILESTLDTILSDADLRSLVLDLRINFGGSDAIGLAIASQFATTDYLAFTKQARNSPTDRSSFTTGQPIMVHLTSRPSFRGPIVELIGPLTQSAGETFTQALMGRALRVIRVGENTQGLFSDTLARRLPNGWTIYLPNEVFRTKEGNAFDAVGIPPDIPVPVFAAPDIVANRDPALAAALGQLALNSP